VEKDHTTNTWVLTLKRLQRLRESERIRAEWWTESFDAVVLATGPYAAPHVPDITGIVDWSKAKEGEQYNMYHSQSYRRPERYANKVCFLPNIQMRDTYRGKLEDSSHCRRLCFCF
jgi:cation diffusion facilitator CzcD-associated flavoprotein CzcO